MHTSLRGESPPQYLVSDRLPGTGQRPPRHWRRIARRGSSPFVCAILILVGVQPTLAQEPSNAVAPARAELIEFCLRTARDELAPSHLRAAAIGALSVCPLTTEAEEFLDRTAKDGSPELKGQAIFALSRWEPEVARARADEWVDRTGRQVLPEIRKIGGTTAEHGSFALALLVASSNRTGSILQQWLSSSDGNAESLGLSVLPGIPRSSVSDEIMNQVRTFENHERLGPEAQLALAIHGETAAARWLEERLNDPGVRFVILSSARHIGGNWPAQQLSPDKVLGAAESDWTSRDLARRIAVAGFAARFGRDRGYLALETLTDRLLSTNPDDRYGLAALAVLGERPRSASRELASRVFHGVKAAQARVLAAKILLTIECSEKNDGSQTSQPGNGMGERP